MQFAQHKNGSEARRRASELRKWGTPVEKILRRALREQTKIYEVKFRYQHPIDPYIVDFVCLPARLIVEIDGMSHDSTNNYDEERQRYLEQQGFRVQRFANADVMKSALTIAATMCEMANELQKSRWQKTPPRLPLAD
jgi:very-short-patch-repair endonuclease